MINTHSAEAAYAAEPRQQERPGIDRRVDLAAAGTRPCWRQGGRLDRPRRRGGLGKHGGGGMVSGLRFLPAAAPCCCSQGREGRPVLAKAKTTKCHDMH